MTTKNATTTNRPLKYDRRFILRIDAKTDAAVRRRAAQLGLSASSLIRMLVTRAINEPKR